MKLRFKWLLSPVFLCLFWALQSFDGKGISCEAHSHQTEKRSTNEQIFKLSRDFGAAISVESVGGGWGQFQTPGFRVLSKISGSSLQRWELLNQQSFKQYFVMVAALLIAHRKTNRLFPFHNFW